MGRQSLYTPELAERVLADLRRHGSTAKAAKAVGVERETVTRWCVLHPEFEPLYARAKAEGIDALVEDTIEIADEPLPSTDKGGVDTGVVAHAKLRIETRRWYAERLAARKYGVLQKLEHSGPDGGPVRAQIVIATGVPDDADWV
jgi:hypothetical protein